MGTCNCHVKKSGPYSTEPRRNSECFEARGVMTSDLNCVLGKNSVWVSRRSGNRKCQRMTMAILRVMGVDRGGCWRNIAEET